MRPPRRRMAGRTARTARSDRRRLPLCLRRPAVAAGPGDGDRRPAGARVVAGGRTTAPSEDVVRPTARASTCRCPVTVDVYGQEGPGRPSRPRSFPAPFRFCLRCGVSYEQVRGNDFAKLATLDAEGRSSATSLTSMSIVRSLRAVPERGPGRGRPQAAHLRRQPAGRGAAGRALQRLRPGDDDPRRAVPGRGEGGGGRRGRPVLRRALPTRVTRALGLAREEYAKEPGEDPACGGAPTRRCARWSTCGSTSTWSAAGGSPCRTWSSTGLLEIGYLGLDGRRRRRRPVAGRLPRAARRVPERAGARSAACCWMRCAGRWPSTPSASTPRSSTASSRLSDGGAAPRSGP